MRTNDIEKGVIRSYLLGSLSSEQQDDLENRLMTEKPVLDELACAEDDLIDGFVRDELDAEERERFRDYFLSTPERHQKVAFARSLKDHVDVQPERMSLASRMSRWLGRIWASDAERPERAPRTREPRLFIFGLRPAWALATAAGWLVVLIGGPGLIVANNNLGRELDQVIATQTDLEERLSSERGQWVAWRGERNELQVRSRDLAEQLSTATVKIGGLEEELGRLRAVLGAAPRQVGTAMASIVSLWLRPRGGTRSFGEAVDRLILPADANLARLQLDIEVDDYERYRVALSEADRGEILTQRQLRAETLEGRVGVMVSVPLELLPPGDYSVRLSGETAAGEIEFVDRYPFRVPAE